MHKFIYVFLIKGRFLVYPEVERYLKSNYRLRKVFCDGSNLLSDIDLGTQFTNKHDPTSIVTISSFEMKLGNERTATLDGK